MAKKLPEYRVIRNQTELKNFHEAHQGQSWMAFDTEFVGERRYQTLLCLIQVASREGYFLIDPLEVDDLGPFLELLVQPDLVKITHAGENDYRIFYDQFGILPRNVFDTQIAAGMVGYRYPLSFGKLTEAELGLTLDKGATVTDWEARPLSKNQIAYALNDVKPLYDLYSELNDRLERLDRVHWATEEMSRLEQEGAYKRHFDLQVVRSRLMGQLRGNEQLIYLRLMRWRRQEAKRKDHSLEMVLSKKLLGAVTRGLARGGTKGLKNNRRIPDRLIGRYKEDWVNMVEKPMEEEERALLEQIPVPAEESPRREALLELLYQAIRFHCLHKGIAVELAFPRGDFRELKDDPELQLFETGWRSELFGDSLLSWFKDSDQLDVRFSDQSISLVRTAD